MRPDISSLLFLDFEASSLSYQSWPIEIGFAWVAPQGAQQDSRLITPDASWDRKDWSAQSQAVHHIPLSTLEQEGMPACDVATWALAMMEGRTIISDSPPHEAHWLSRLLKTQPASPSQPLLINHYDAVLGEFLQSAGLDAAWEYNAKHPRPHRAGADALLMAKALIHGLEVDSGQRPLRP